MTSMYDEASPAVLVVVARLTVDQHRNTPGQASYAPGTCRQCTPTGCLQLEWAQRTLTEHNRSGLDQ